MSVQATFRSWLRPFGAVAILTALFVCSMAFVVIDDVGDRGVGPIPSPAAAPAPQPIPFGS
jgi:hypothetical protein